MTAWMPVAACEASQRLTPAGRWKPPGSPQQPAPVWPWGAPPEGTRCAAA
jgi:hypothetical protein